MKVAVIFSVAAPTNVGFVWKWRARDSNQESAQDFVFYADCVADAKHCGYMAQELQARGPNAPARGFGDRLS
jgi:hypothetical protein